MRLGTVQKLAVLVASLALSCGNGPARDPVPDSVPDASAFDASVVDAGPALDADPLTVTFLHQADGGAVPIESLVYSRPFFLRVTGAAPGATVNITTRLQRLESTATFQASAAGIVDTSTDAPIRGTYTGVDAEGLVWSMGPSTINFGTSFDIGAEVAVMDGEQTFARLARPGMGTGTQLQRVTVGSFPGFFYRWSGERRPAVLVLGGSECRLASTNFVAAYVTTAGYHALALDYCTNGIISQVPLESLMAAIDWLVAQPDVDSTKLAVMGGSRGGELALELAARDPRLKAVIAVVPSIYRWGDTGLGSNSAWTFGGADLPTIPNAPGAPNPTSERLDGGIIGYRLTPVFQADLTSATDAQRTAATIELERSKAHVLLVGGADDGIWPSCHFVDVAWSRLSASQHQLTHAADRQLCLAGAGHGVGAPGWSSRDGYSSFNASLGGQLISGGTVEGRGRGNRAYDTAWRTFLEVAFRSP